MACVFSGENLRLMKEKDHTWPLNARREKKESIDSISLLSRSTCTRTPAPNNTYMYMYIAAIDFGSTYTSIAWTTAADTQEINCLKLNEVHPRVPTAILLKEGDPVKNENGVTIGITCKPDSIGIEAQNSYPKLKNRDRHNYIYFERMKMRLQHDQDVHRSMKICSDDRDGKNREWYLIEVISFIICYLKNKLINHLSMAGHGILKATEVDWTITVPAIWQARGKQMMREAGYLAGLCGGDEIKYLSYTTSNVQKQMSKQVIPSKLLLVPEPEAAALYCQQMKQDDVAKFCRDELEMPHNPQQYIVVDIGGGTVDITAQEIIPETGKVKVILAPQGNDCGGMKVNRKFAQFFQKITDEEETEFIDELELAFPKMLQQNMGLKSTLNSFIYNDFEAQKEIFGRKSKDENASAEIALKIPYKINNNMIESRLLHFFTPEQVELEEDKIFLKSAIMNDFFQPAIQGILDCLQKALADLLKKGSLPTVIYLVGGFGGCKYVYQCIYELLATKYSDLKFSVFVPEKHRLAVVYGAVLYKKRSAITSRCLNRTYGIALSMTYNPGHHKIEHLKYNEDGDKICDDAFLTFLKKDDQVSIEDVAVDEILSDIDKEKIIYIPFYSSEDSSLEYLTQRSSNGGEFIPLATKIGELIVEIPEGDILHKDQRCFQIILDFSSAEIHATVRYLNNNTEVNTKLDFLA